MYPFLFILLGIVVGFLVTIFINKNSENKSRQRFSELDKEKSVLDTKYNQTLEEYTKSEHLLKTERENTIKQSTRIATLENENKNLLEKLQSQKIEIEELQKRLTTEFENIANKILKERANEFTSINQKSIGELLNPLKEKISSFEKKVEDTYNNETREKATLRKELEQIIKTNQQMSDDAQRLTQALKGDSKTQGDWGEWQLELLLEKSGLQKDLHFTQQQSLKNDEGLNQRPDYIINLPDNKQYIIDSKVSLTAYERYFNEEDENLKQRFLKEHTNSIIKHISDLSVKNYQNLYGINSPDFVFMFIALEPALTIALQNDPTLFEKALQKNIVLVSTTTLLASLRTVSFIWKQENQKNNVFEIAKESGALYDKFVGFIDDLIKVGQTIDTSKKIYADAMNKLTESTRKGDTVIGRFERIKELGAKATKSLPQSIIDKAIEKK